MKFEGGPPKIVRKVLAVSRQFVRTSAEILKALMERDLSDRDFVALFIDGKGFEEDAMIIALGAQ